MIKYDGIEFFNKDELNSYMALQEIFEDESNKENEDEVILKNEFSFKHDDADMSFEYDYVEEQELIFES